MITILIFLNAIIALSFAMVSYLFSLGSLFLLSVVLIAAAIGSIVAGSQLARDRTPKFKLAQIVSGLLNSSFFLLISLSFITREAIPLIVTMISAVVIYTGSAIALLLSGNSRRNTNPSQQTPLYEPSRETDQSAKPHSSIANAAGYSKKSDTQSLTSTQSSKYIARFRSVAIIFLFTPILLPVAASIAQGVLTSFTNVRIGTILQAQIMGIAGISGFLLLVIGIWILLYLKTRS